MPRGALVAPFAPCHARPVRRLPAFLSRLIALVLLLQAAMAPAHCLAHAPMAGTPTEICTDHGRQVLRITADGALAPEIAHGEACAACHALPQGPRFAVPVLPPPAWAAAPPAWHAAAAELLPARARAPPFEATGPPTRS